MPKSTYSSSVMPFGVRYTLRNRQANDFRRERAEAALEQAVLAREAQASEACARDSRLRSKRSTARPVYLRDKLDGVLHGLGAAVGQNRLLR